MQFGCCIKSGFHGKGFVRLYWYVLKHQSMINEEAAKRVKILVFWEKHGVEATLEAFVVFKTKTFLSSKITPYKSFKIHHHLLGYFSSLPFSNLLFIN